MAVKDLKINEEIMAKEVRLVGSDGEQSVVSLSKALEIAREMSLDLVEMSPNAVPPVCRVLDYGKYKFDKEKKLKESKKRQKVVKLKEVRMQPKISVHDLNFKSRQVNGFLQEGNKVKVTVRFRGRELAHTDLGRKLLERMLEFLDVAYILEQSPRMEGRTMSMMLGLKKD